MLGFLVFHLVEPCRGLPVYLHDIQGNITLTQEDIGFNAPIPIPASCAWHIEVEHNKVKNKLSGLLNCSCSTFLSGKTNFRVIPTIVHANCKFN